MLLLRIGLLWALLSLVATYPMAAPAKSEQLADLDPADYPDLTNGLSDAEVESTLNGLSLDDLNELNKLLDDAGSGPFDLQASLRGHHRQGKKQHYTDVENIDEDVEANLKPAKLSQDDGCHDEEDVDKECTERPKCKRPTTRRCTTTRKCSTPCRSLDGFLDIHVDGSKSENSKMKSKPVEECDPEDTICLQRAQHRSKQRPNMHDFAEVQMDRQAGNIDSLEQLAAQAHRDESVKINKQLEGWNGKDMGDSLPDMSNMNFGKFSNSYAADNMNDFKEIPKLDSAWPQDKVAEDEGHAQPIQEEEPKQLQLKAPYHDRHDRARAVHMGTQQLEDKSDDYKQMDELDGSNMEENMQINSASAMGEAKANDESEAGEPLTNDGDSFIAQNAREPMRYLIKTDGGDIKSEDEPIEQQLREDKEHSEMLNFDQPFAQNGIQESKRTKRENSQATDDAPENNNESYLKKLLDSFPRDQNGQSNLKVAIRQLKRPHLRVKRS